MADGWIRIGRYRGLVNPHVDSPLLRSSLAKIAEAVSGPDAVLLQAGRHRTVRVALQDSHGRLDAVVKIFGRQSLPKDIYDRFRGTKARRTFATATFLSNAGIGTTPPLACLERWRFGKLTWSCFVSLYMADIVCFKDELAGLWKAGAPYSAFESLISCAARGIRRLHDAGCRHGDLGNQNVFFAGRPSPGAYGDAVFIDLNRARFGGPLTTAERAKDLCRIWLPRGFLPLFFKRYWGGDAPRGFEREWKRFWVPFRIHTRTRKLRHPLRELAYRLDPRKAPAKADYPPSDRQWVFDDRRFRPAAPLLPKTMLRLLERPYRREARRGQIALLKGLASADARAKALPAPAAGADAAPPPVFRLIVEGTVASHDADLARLAAAGVKKALVRFSLSDGEERTAAKLMGAAMLADAGVSVAVLVAQAPRFAKPGFSDFASRVASALSSRFDWICAGQGVNTVSWCIRSADDARDVISAGERLVYERPPRSIAVAASAVETPVLQLGCHNLERLFGRNVQYVAATLAWDGEGKVVDEVAALRAIAARTFYPDMKVLLVCDAAWRRGCPEEHALAGALGEICATAITE